MMKSGKIVKLVSYNNKSNYITTCRLVDQLLAQFISPVLINCEAVSMPRQTANSLEIFDGDANTSEFV
jgi:hypothetical protein